MKKIVFLLAATVQLAACQNGQTETSQVEPTQVEADSTATASATSPADGQDEEEQENSSLNGIITIDPNHYANVTLLMGGTVNSIAIKPGQFVSKGQTIATLSNPEFVDLQQTYLESSAQVEYLKADYIRQQELTSNGAASQKILQQSQAEYKAMQSRLDASATRLQQLGINPSSIVSDGICPYLKIAAPISGYVADIAVNMGKYLSAGERVCDIIDQSEVFLQLNAYEKDLSLIQIGDKLTFTTSAVPGNGYEATVKYIDQMVDESSHSVRVYALVTNGSKLFRTGMYVRAKKAN
ncbi:MAG: efflux RND transporter periplasmic adaptor subunit [Bacteroidaceae bacterium]|nr:efflux RND transporter periplasmic adaptor subunit [Bacteroidaceae bacterium]